MSWSEIKRRAVGAPAALSSRGHQLGDARNQRLRPDVRKAAHPQLVGNLVVGEGDGVWSVCQVGDEPDRRVRGAIASVIQHEVMDEQNAARGQGGLRQVKQSFDVLLVPKLPSRGGPGDG